MRRQIAKHVPGILRWALGAEHDVRVASVSFLMSLGTWGAHVRRASGADADPASEGSGRILQAGVGACRTVRLEGPLEVPLAGLDVQMREWLRNASTVSATVNSGPSCAGRVRVRASFRWAGDRTD